MGEAEESVLKKRNILIVKTSNTCSLLCVKILNKDVIRTNTGSKVRNKTKVLNYIQNCEQGFFN